MTDELELTAYRVNTEEERVVALIPGVPAREWINNSPDRFAARCLPLLMANQSGWLMLNPVAFQARWNGGDSPDDVEIRIEEHDAPYSVASAHFGVGVLTFSPPWLFRTPPGWTLLARGPANWPKDGISALEGLVETDWAPMTFTMNWRFTQVGMWITFKQAEPFCMVVPQQRHILERFTPVERPLTSDPDLDTAYRSWGAARDAFNASLNVPGSPEIEQGWQKHYARGLSYEGVKAPEHQTRLKLREMVFEDPDATDEGNEAP